MRRVGSMHSNPLMRSRPVSDNDGPSPVKEVGGNRSRRVLCRVFHLNVEAFGRLLYLERRKEGKEGKEGGESEGRGSTEGKGTEMGTERRRVLESPFQVKIHKPI